MKTLIEKTPSQEEINFASQYRESIKNELKEYDDLSNKISLYMKSLSEKEAA